MFDHARLVRLCTAALASCAVTWALAVGAFAVPATDVPTDTGTTPAPAFKAVPGDIDKAPRVATAPAYQPAIGDHLKTPVPAHVQRIHTVARDGRLPSSVPGGGDDHGTVALALVIVGLLAAFGAGTVLVTRSHRPMLGA